MSRTPYGPKVPADFTRPVGTVADALDDLAANAGGGGVTDHGALTGLGDDDHTQYAKNTTSFTSSGRIVATGATSRDIVESGASVDPTGAISSQGADISTGGGNFVPGPGLVDGRDVSVDGTKLDGIESGATADQTDAEILAAWEAESGRDASADGSKLDGIESGATADQTDAEILTAWETETGRDVSVDGTKLDGIEALADVTDAANVDAAGAVMESDLSGTGFPSFTAAFSTWTAGRVMTGGTGINVTNGNGVGGNPTFAVDGTVLVDGDFSANGVMCRTSAGGYTTRTITAGTGISVSNGTGQIGNPTITSTVVNTTQVQFVEATSTSSTSQPLSVGNIDTPSGNALGIVRMPFDGDVRNIALVVEVTAAVSNPKLGWILYKATSAGASFGLFNLTTTAGTVMTVGTNVTTDLSFTAGTLSFNEGEYLSMTYFRSGGSAATVQDMRAYLTLQET